MNPLDSAPSSDKLMSMESLKALVAANGASIARLCAKLGVKVDVPRESTPPPATTPVVEPTSAIIIEAAHGAVTAVPGVAVALTLATPAACSTNCQDDVTKVQEAARTPPTAQLLGVVMPASGLPLTCSLQHTEADKERVERPMPWPSFACDCQRLISMQPQQIPQGTQPWSRNAFNPDHLGEMAGANQSLVCSFVSHTIAACCQMMDVEHTPHLRDAWNMVEGINSWPAKSLLLEDCFRSSLFDNHSTL
jgi:hypothetical protein